MKRTKKSSGLVGVWRKVTPTCLPESFMPHITGVELSANVLTLSNEFGLRFGKYCHTSKTWLLDGVRLNHPIQVSYFAEINLPK